MANNDKKSLEEWESLILFAANKNDEKSLKGVAKMCFEHEKIEAELAKMGINNDSLYESLMDALARISIG